MKYRIIDVISNIKYKSIEQAVAELVIPAHVVRLSLESGDVVCYTNKQFLFRYIN